MTNKENSRTDNDAILHVRLPSEEKNAFARRCESIEKSQSHMVRQLVRAWLLGGGDNATNV